jgi:long-chain acyl-CoA synthetase
MENVHDPGSRTEPRWRNLRELFLEIPRSSTEYFQYDSGYRIWKHSYAQLRCAATHFSLRLQQSQIRKGDTIILWSENRPEWVAAFWGCVLAGAVVVPIDYRSSLSFASHIHKIVSAKLLLLGDEVEATEWGQEARVWRLRDLEWPKEECAIPSMSMDRDDRVEIVFTSGATGEPKGVLITHRNILANIDSPLRIVSDRRRWFLPFLPLRFLSLIPLSHMFGQTLVLFILPFIPGTAVFLHGYSPHEITRQVRARRISAVLCVPKILELLQQYVVLQFPAAAAPPAATSHLIFRWWRYRRLHRFLGWKFWAFVVGAAALDRELEEFWSRLGFAVIQGYGLTETAPIVAFNDPFHIQKGTVGRPVAGVEVKIAPDGEILIRGDCVTPGYYQLSSGTGSAFTDGWFRTGDIGSFDDTNHLVIRGRKKEMIVTPQGLNVFPEDVEAVLNSLPGVRESAVVGHDTVYAVLVLRDKEGPDGVIGLANQRLEAHQRIRGVAVWPGEHLPRTKTTHKLKRAEIQAWVETGRPAAPSGTGEETVIGLVRRYAPERSVLPDSTLDQLGLSSLDRVELMLDLERKFDISIDEELLTGNRTVASLEDVNWRCVVEKFPTWNRCWIARAVRHLGLAILFLPFVRAVAWARISGEENLDSLRGPVIFAPNHQSHLDTPLILSALPVRYRYKVAPAMWKEYFEAHFFPDRHTHSEWLRDGLLYWLVALFFNAFPIPQTEAGASQSLRYLGELVSDEESILFFPEGERTEAGEIKRFQGGHRTCCGEIGRACRTCSAAGSGKGASSTCALAAAGAGRDKVRGGASIPRKRLCGDCETS